MRTEQFEEVINNRIGNSREQFYNILQKNMQPMIDCIISK